MKKFIISSILVLYIITTNFTITFAQTKELFDNPFINVEDEDSLNLAADSAILMDAATGEVLYNKNMDKQEYPASITKLMTALLALEYDGFDETITMSENAVYGIERNSSHIALDVEEEINMLDALYAVLVVSANEAAIGIAEHIDGSVEKFAKHMTERAKELGCENTNFVNPNGLHDDNHYTTARDMAIIARELLKYDLFREIIATNHYIIPPTNKQNEERNLWAQHKMIREGNGYYYEGCEGGKTGFTNEAQNTLVTYSKKDDMELIAVVLKNPGATIYTDTTALFNYGYENYKTVLAYSGGKVVQNVSIIQTVDEDEKNLASIKLSSDIDDIYITLPKSYQNADFKTEISAPPKLEAPITAGEKYGEFRLMLDGKTAFMSDMVASNSVLPVIIDKSAHSSKIYSILLKIAAVVFLIMAIVVYLIMTIKEKRRRRRRAAKIKELRRRRKELYKYKNV